MAKPIKLQRDYEALMAELGRCKHPVSRKGLAALDRCRDNVLQFRRKYPRLSRDKAEFLDLALQAIESERQKVKGPKMITVFDLVRG